MLVPAAAPPARADDWPDPAKWDRKYPFDGPNHADFYRLASIRAALLNLVGEQFYRHVILEWTGYTPIIATSDTIFVTGCKPHACDTDEVTTVIQGRRISVCVYHVFPSSGLSTVISPSERLWFIEGVGLPAVERDPDDNDQCTFESMDDLRVKLRNARAQAE